MLSASCSVRRAWPPSDQPPLCAKPPSIETIGDMAPARSRRVIFSAGTFIASASSATDGVRPSCSESLARAARIRRSESCAWTGIRMSRALGEGGQGQTTRRGGRGISTCAWTGIRMSRALLAMARRIAWRIHHVAYLRRGGGEPL